EIFDVVDENDLVIDQRPRSDVHRLNLYHRATHVLVFNDAEKLFLQKRSMAKDSSPGLWDSSAAGHLDQGESYDACARREFSEELGVSDPPPLRRLFKLPASPASDYEFAWIYRCEYNGPMQLQAEEIDEGRWFTAEQIDDWIAARPEQLTSAFRLIWQRLRSGGSTIPRE
ncbi:MAG: NUDIX domain-containing protein, partial [Gammaproteobacteria bacterium]|nr:NUDIX domain-containing protein [Gammaproteobacteria bacterium]